MVDDMGVPLAERTVGPVVKGVGLQRCCASASVTKVPVAPESRIAVRGGATSGEVTNALEVLRTADAPPRQLGVAGSQKQSLVLPPCMLVKVAVGWWPGDLLLQSALVCAQAPWVQQ